MCAIGPGCIATDLWVFILSFSKRVQGGGGILTVSL